MIPREKKCKVCKQPYSPFNSLQTACSTKCALTLAETNLKRKYKARTTVLRSQFRETDRKHQTKVAQQAFNAYIRARDGQYCISCGATSGQFHAGHFISVGHGGSILRFSEKNCNVQCARCNSFKSGNIISYRIGLVKKYGEKQVTEIECTKGVKKYTIDELKAITAEYKQKLADLTPPDDR